MPLLDIELPLWTIRPNWRNGILERLSWLTDVLPSTYGPEQRRALRLSPRREFEISFNPIDSVRSYFDLFLHRLGSTEFMLPLFHDMGRISAQINNGDTVVPVDTTYREFEVGGLAILLGPDPFTYGKLEVTAIAADSITVEAGGVLRTWPKGSAVYPLRRSRLSMESRFAALSPRVGDSTLEFTLNQANDIPDEGAWGTLYNGYPVLTDKPNRREQLDVDYIRNAMTLDNEHGIPELLDDAGRAFTLQTTSHMMRGRAEHWAFRQFLYRLKGQRDSIWLPSYNRDVELARAALAANDYIDIKKIGYDYTGGAVSGRHHLLIDGAITREIVDVGAPLALDEERLELNAALGADKAAGVFASFMEPCRLSNDTVEIVHHTDTNGAAECNLSWKAFRDERTTDGALDSVIPNTAENVAPCGMEFATLVEIDAEINGSTTTAGGLISGVTISGLDPAGQYLLSLPTGQTYIAYSVWGRPFFDPLFPVNSGSSHRFNVIPDGEPLDMFVVETPGGPFDGYEAARAAFMGEILTGAESYTFFILDTPLTDNSGGLSILVQRIA